MAHADKSSSAPSFPSSQDATVGVQARCESEGGVQADGTVADGRRRPLQRGNRPESSSMGGFKDSQLYSACSASPACTGDSCVAGPVRVTVLDRWLDRDQTAQLPKRGQ